MRPAYVDEFDMPDVERVPNKIKLAMNCQYLIATPSVCRIKYFVTQEEPIYTSPQDFVAPLIVYSDRNYNQFFTVEIAVVACFRAE